MAATVKRTAQSALTLWGRTSSSNTQKVLWTLAELDLTYSLVHASARLGPNSELLGSTEVFGIVDTPECVHHRCGFDRLPLVATRCLWIAQISNCSTLPGQVHTNESTPANSHAKRGALQRYHQRNMGKQHNRTIPGVQVWSTNALSNTGDHGPGLDVDGLVSPR